MCRHCRNLELDKKVVHDFMEQAARRINQKWAKETPTASPITADDLEVSVEVVQFKNSVHRMLKEMTE